MALNGTPIIFRSIALMRINCAELFCSISCGCVTVCLTRISNQCKFCYMCIVVGTIIICVAPV